MCVWVACGVQARLRTDSHAEPPLEQMADPARARAHTCTCAHALEQKADVNVAGMVNGFTPLFAACENNDLVRSTRNA